MLYSLSLSFLYQRDKEAVLPWIAGIISLESFYSIIDLQASTAVSKGFSSGSSLLLWSSMIYLKPVIKSRKM